MLRCCSVYGPRTTPRRTVETAKKKLYTSNEQPKRRYDDISTSRFRAPEKTKQKKNKKSLMCLVHKHLAPGTITASLSFLFCEFAYAISITPCGGREKPKLKPKALKINSKLKTRNLIATIFRKLKPGLNS